MDLDVVLPELARDPSAPVDLAELALELARDEYPDVDVGAYLGEINGMAHEARALIGGGLEARVHGLCRYLFHEMGFRGNTQEYYDPRNSYFNQVLERRTGIPITLSALAMAVGARAGIELVGVGLPGHFIVKAFAGRQEVLFDPFHGGRPLTPEQCEHLVFQVTGNSFSATQLTLQPLPLGPMITRMLGNLKGVYVKLGDHCRAVRVIRRMRQINPTDAALQRDLGINLLHAGKAGLAIDHLQSYLAADGAPQDAEAVRRLLDHARNEVARWN